MDSATITENHDETGERSGEIGTLARILGVFSLGLGLTELGSPRQLARLIGAREHSSLLRAYGAREIASGVGILGSQNPTAWLWSRVIGDCLDLATVAAFYAEADEEGRKRMVPAIAALVGVGALDLACASAHS